MVRCVVQAELQVLAVDSIDVYQPSVLAKCRDSGSEFLHSTIRQAATLALYATTLTCRIACTIPVAADVATTASDAAASLSHPAAVAVREFARRLIDALLDHVVAFTRYGGAIAWALGGAECLHAYAGPPQQQQQRQQQQQQQPAAPRLERLLEEFQAEIEEEHGLPLGSLS